MAQNDKPLDPSEIVALREMLDRQAILDCIHRYTRGLDRLDRELMVSAYHPDAMDFHNFNFSGTVNQFADWVFDYHSKNQITHQHFVTNHVCELKGDVAHAETYYLYAGVNKSGNPMIIKGGRYVDRFEKRNGHWAIAERVCINEWGSETTGLPHTPEQLAGQSKVGVVARDKTDVSYMRPLRGGRAALG